MSESNVVQMTAIAEDELPVPSGYKILIAMPEIEETYDGGLVKTEQAKEIESVSSVIGLVLDIGPDAYQDKTKFPSGPWCKEGDYILMRAYTGTRFRLKGKEFRMINDDHVEGVVKEHRGYTRA